MIDSNIVSERLNKGYWEKSINDLQSELKNFESMKKELAENKTIIEDLNAQINDKNK